MPGCGTALALSERNTAVNEIMWNTCVQHTISCQNGCCLKAPLFRHAAAHTVNLSAADGALCFQQRIFSSAIRDLLVTFVGKTEKTNEGTFQYNFLKCNLEEWGIIYPELCKICTTALAFTL